MPACNAEWNERLSAWFDGEVDAAEAEETARHVRDCPACTEAQRGFGDLRATLRSSREAPRNQERIRARVLGTIAARRRPRLLAGAIAALLALGLGAALTRPSLGEALTSDLEAQHLKGFAHGRPCEFESSDHDAVGDWIEDTTSRVLPVPEVPGATLIGARRCKVAGGPAVALVYRVEGRGLTVFLPPESSRVAEAASRFASDGTRCERGALGERICAAATGPRAAFAVGDEAPAVLLASAAVR